MSTTKTAVLWLTAGSVMLAGCATASGSKAKETEAIKAQVASLESQLNTVNQRIEEVSQRQGALEANLQAAQASQATQTESGSPRKAASSLNHRQVQLALKTAGFYAGPVDGKLGPQTKEAVKAFQRSNGLTPDGTVGSKTASLLSRYLENERQ